MRRLDTAGLYSADLCSEVVVSPSGCISCWWRLLPSLSCFVLIQAISNQAMMYWLQQLQMRRWEFCNAQSRFPVGSSQLVNEPLAGRTSRCCVCEPFFCFQPPLWWMVLLIWKWGEVLDRFVKAGASYQCLVDVWNLWTYSGWTWMGCFLIHSVWLEMLRYLTVINFLLIFLMHVKCAHWGIPFLLWGDLQQANFF